jgi:DNA-binding NarL/FixJ family response regulator
MDTVGVVSTTPIATPDSAPIPTPIALAVVDDDPMVRAALGMMLGGSSGIRVVAEAGDGEEALRVVPSSGADVVLMDIRMPVRDGLSAAEELLRSHPDLRIIVLTTFDTDDMVLRALRIGAAGFLLKDTPPARLVEAIRTVASGQPMLSPSVTAQLIAAVTGDGQGAAAQERSEAAQAALSSLTERERDVAAAVARGLSNAEIAAELFMGVPTVKTHVGRLFTKLGVENRVQVAILVHDAQP